MNGVQVQVQRKKKTKKNLLILKINSNFFNRAIQTYQTQNKKQQQKKNNLIKQRSSINSKENKKGENQRQ